MNRLYWLIAQPYTEPRIAPDEQVGALHVRGSAANTVTLNTHIPLISIAQAGLSCSSYTCVPAPSHVITFC